MKKFIITLLALILAFSLSVSAIAVNLNKQSDDFTVTEEVIYGNKAIAQNYSIITRYQLNNQLFWETEYQNGSTNTSFEYFDTVQYHNEEINYQGVTLPSSIEFDFDTTVPAEKQQGISKAIKEIYDSIGPSGEEERTVFLKDYYEYYPVSVNIDLPHISWNVTGYENLEIYNYKDIKEVYDRFYEFFKIPVIEEDFMILSVGKDLGGISMGIEESCYSLGNTAYKEHNIPTYTKNRAYFPINNYSYNTKTGEDIAQPDLGKIEGGYGIYSIDYSIPSNQRESGIDPSSLTTAFPLNEDETVLFLGVDKSEEHLIIMTSNMNDTFVYDISTKSHKLINKTTYENEATGFVRCIRKDNFFLFAFNENIALFEKDAKGYKEALFIEDAFSKFDEYTDIHSGTAVHYKDGQLAIADSLIDEIGYESCGCYLAVYNKEGLQYYGKLKNSIDSGYSYDNYSDNCMPSDFENILIKRR